MTPSDAKTVSDFLISDFIHEMQTTMAVLGAVPSGNLTHRPDAKSKTGLGLARHITLEDEWMLNSIANSVFTPPPDDSDACGIMTPAEAVARYQAKVPPALDRVRALSGEESLRVIDLLGMIQLPTLNFVSMAVKHSVHHRGQLSTYLRAMGGRVPGSYGRGADSRE